MTFSTLIFAYLVSTLAGISFLALYSDMRRKRFEPASSEDRIFRCEDCGYVYTDDPDVDRSRCPQCDMYNESFHF